MTVQEKNAVVPGTLYLVSTPIGNLDDLSARALKILSGVDFIAAEDTRNTGKLLSLFEIRRELVPYHEHNKASAGPEICARLAQGQSCALVTDAGTPAISDPGEDLVRLCIEANIPVTAIPGPCAAINALCLSGLDTTRFVFEGFLPTETGPRNRRLQELAYETRTFVLHEAPHRLIQTLRDLIRVLGEDRQLSVCREMTKLNEEIVRGSLREILSHFESNPIRGEFVLVLAGSADKAEDGSLNELSIEEHVRAYVNSGMTQKDAIKACAKDRGVPKNDIYMALAGKKE